jgi:hypothetical protein
MMAKPNYDTGPGKRPGDGRHVGYCNTCGADTFDGIRHRCPPKIDERTLGIIIAAKEYVWARRALRSTTIENEFARTKAEVAERHYFASLEVAILNLERDTTPPEAA